MRPKGKYNFFSMHYTLLISFLPFFDYKDDIFSILPIVEVGNYEGEIRLQISFNKIIGCESDGIGNLIRDIIILS